MTDIATVGADLPQDLLAATGRFVGPLGWIVERPTPRADRWLECKFAPWARSIAQDWADGAFDHLAAVIFSRSDDNSHRLYYYLCELRSRGLVGGPEPIIFDSALLPRRSSADHMVAGVRKLAERLGLGDDALEGGIALTNSARRAAMQQAKAPPAGPICLLEGTPPPDDRLHDLIAAAGWHACGQTLSELWADAGALVVAGSGDPAAAIGAQLHATQKGPRGQFDPARRVVDRAQALAARAAILWYTEEEEALVWHLPAQRLALEAAGVAVLSLTRRDWAGRDGVEHEIADFLKGIAQ